MSSGCLEVADDVSCIYPCEQLESKDISEKVLSSAPMKHMYKLILVNAQSKHIKIQTEMYARERKESDLGHPRFALRQNDSVPPPERGVTSSREGAWDMA